MPTKVPFRTHNSNVFRSLIHQLEVTAEAPQNLRSRGGPILLHEGQHRFPQRLPRVRLTRTYRWKAGYLDERVSVAAVSCCTRARAMAASKTAEYVALYRALESLERRRPRLFLDPFATLFLSRPLRLAVTAAHSGRMHAALSRYADGRAPGARSSAIARTRFIDDSIRAAMSGGVTQLVILGAGFDCRAHRMPELSDATVFELDRRDTQSEKRRRLGTSNISIRRDVHYVAVDFLRDSTAESLAAAGWSAERPSLFVWEGVTNYLTEKAVTDVLSWMGSTAPGSRVVFTYVHSSLIDGTIRFSGGERILENVRALGEPWTFGLHPERVAAYLSGCGLALIEDLGADDYRARYLPQSAGERPGYSFYRIAVASRLR